MFSVPYGWAVIRFPLWIRSKLEQVAQGGCGCPISGGFKGQAGCGSGQPGLVVGDPEHSREVETWWSLWSFSTQVVLWFYDSMILALCPSLTPLLPEHAAKCWYPFFFFFYLTLLFLFFWACAPLVTDSDNSVTPCKREIFLSNISGFPQSLTRLILEGNSENRFSRKWERTCSLVRVFKNMTSNITVRDNICYPTLIYRRVYE